MDHAALLFSLAVVDFAAAMTPGPNFVLVTETALSRSRRHSMAVVTGFVISNLVWCIAVMAGLAALFAFSPWLYTVLRVAGGAYLIFLGASLWLRRGEPMTKEVAESSVAMSLVRGILTNLANPKSVIYFGSIFATFLRPGTPLAVHLIAVAIVLTNTMVWYGTVAMVFSAAAVRTRYLALRRMINRAAGTLMVVFGLRLMLERR